MKLPLLIKVYFRLRKGWKRLSPEAQTLVKLFVRTQQVNGEYMNAGGKAEDYYTQFGKVLETVFSPLRIVSLPIRRLTVKEALDKNSVYGHFFRFIFDELRFRYSGTVSVDIPEKLTTNSVCCILSMQYQTNGRVDEKLVEWLKDRQDETGGFYSSEVAPVPDLLTTAVALFTLRLIGENRSDAEDFIDAHWMENGGFAPTIYDEYSDVEYVFYGLLALGSNE